MIESKWRSLSWVVLAVISIFVFVVGSATARAGTFWEKHFYFPAVKRPEENWRFHAWVYSESAMFRKFRDVSKKPYEVRIKDKKGRVLYSEDGEVTAGFVRATAVWEKAELLKITVTNEADGKVLLERTLEYNPAGDLFELKQATGP